MPAQQAAEKKAAKKNTGAKPSDHKSSFAKVLAGVLIVTIVLNAGIAFFAYDYWVLSQERQQLASLAQTQAQTQAGIIQRYLTTTTQQLQAFTSRDDIIAAAEQNNVSQLDNFVGEIHRRFDNARGVRIDARNSVEVNADAEVPLGFSEVDMINRANRRQAVFPEAVERENEWRINMVEPIPFAAPNAEDPPRVLATLFVSFSATDMLSALGTTDLAQGNTLLLQKFAQGDAQPIVQVGQGGGGISQEANVANSHWIIRFTPSPAFAEQANVSATLVIVVLFLIAVTTIAGSLVLAERISRTVTSRGERAAMAARTAATLDKTAASANSNKKLLEMEVKAEDANILNLQERGDVDPLDIVDQDADQEGDVPLSIFRSYDIRGIVPSQLSPANVVLIGKAVGSMALDAGEKTLVVGKDGRSHSNDISEQLIEGILSTGCNVINLGMVPTPMVYFAIAELQTTDSGVSVTASHNPPEYNGFKVVINGNTLADDEIRQIHSRIVAQQFAKGAGKEDFSDLSFQYIDRIASDIAIATDLKIVLDCGNGVTGDIAPRVFTELGCEVIPLYCKVDGTFPNHQPDPAVADNLRDLIAKVKEESADIGIALDGDGDRLGVVSGSGAIIWPDRLLMLLAKDILSRNPGKDVIFDVKCSRNLNTVISTYGGRPIMWKSGHSHMKSKMKETSAVLGGELSGHIFIGERWYGFDDGIYAAARILEIMSLREQDLDSIFESFPVQPSTPELRLKIAEEKKFAFMKRLVVEGEFGDGRLTTIDGLRVDYPTGWGLIRASNTSPYLTLRFEAEDEDSLAKIKSVFKQQIHKVDPQLGIGF